MKSLFKAHHLKLIQSETEIARCRDRQTSGAKPEGFKPVGPKNLNAFSLRRLVDRIGTLAGDAIDFKTAKNGLTTLIPKNHF